MRKASTVTIVASRIAVPVAENQLNENEAA
jgi:hypothetical protein